MLAKKGESIDTIFEAVAKEGVIFDDEIAFRYFASRTHNRDSSDGHGGRLAEPPDPLHRSVCGRRFDRRRRACRRRLSVAHARPTGHSRQQVGRCQPTLAWSMWRKARRMATRS